jgi:PBSX family phage terminase large subunit
VEQRSTPSFNDFNPTIIPFQNNVMYDFRKEIDFSLGTQELLFSGSVGSAKSILAAHMAVLHCVENVRARVLIGRVSLPDVKATIFKLICEHLEGSQLVLNKDYWVNESTGYIYFRNGSEIMSRSWADKKYDKVRSLALSAAIIEEATENRGDHQKAIFEIKQRVGRLPHIKTNFIIYCTNPDGPSHWLYKYFFEDQSPTRRVYKSKTKDNPFLPDWYIEQLERDLDPKEARRMLYGEWVEIDKERIYYAYDINENFKKEDYKINLNLPIGLSFDFNIGYNKPMSCVLSQYDPTKETYHFFDEVIIHGARTESILEDAAARGLLDFNVEYEIFGDATGAARSTNSLHSDYDIIENFLKKYRRKDGKPLSYKMKVPKSNPPIRERHNVVNAYCLNSIGQRRFFVYQKAKTLHEGMKLTALKEGAQYLEDDSKEYQHCTTAIGYQVVYTHDSKSIKRGYQV